VFRDEVNQLKQRQLGNTGEQVSTVGLGCMGLVGWYGERDDAEAAATVQRALEIGVTHLDTAAVYQDGENERFVGSCIKGQRDRVFLATKCGMERSSEGKIQVDTRPEIVRQSCDASLQRLGTDHIDLFYLHRIDPVVPIEESMGAMAELVDAGKVRFVGISEASPATLRRAHATYPVTALQSELSLWSEHSAQPALDACRELDIAFVAYSPLGRGFLTGAMNKMLHLPQGDTRNIFPRFQKDNLDANLAAAEQLTEISESMGCTAAQLALAWVLAKWDGVLPIPGTKKRKYLEENAAAADIELTAADMAEIARRLPEDLVHGERYPEMMMGTVNL
jgi:aryl-alcohol dehydrogenase-like predicted oxidoreductase